MIKIPREVFTKHSCPKVESKGKETVAAHCNLPVLLGDVNYRVLSIFHYSLGVNNESTVSRPAEF